jgi:hypothetical protein
MLQKYPTATEQDRTGKLFWDVGVATLIGMINRVGTDRKVKYRHAASEDR